MFLINRMIEINTLGYSVNHIVRDMYSKDAFLFTLYKEVMEIAVEVINTANNTSVENILDDYLQNTNLDYDTRLSIFEYLLNFIKRFIGYCKIMRIPDEMKYEFEMKNDGLCTGRDIIKIDIYKTHHVINELINKGTQEETVLWKKDVIDNPTVEDFSLAFWFDQNTPLPDVECNIPQSSHQEKEDIGNENKES